MKLNEREILQTIMSLLDDNRGYMKVDDHLNFINFMLLWAKYIPQTKNDIIGYFDFIEGVDSIKKFNAIIQDLSKLTDIKISYLLGRHEMLKEALVGRIDSYRSSLLHIAKALVKGNNNEVTWIVDSIQHIKKNHDPNYDFGPGFINESALYFSQLIFEDAGAKENDVINCLFPCGTTSALYFSDKRNISFYEKNDYLKTCTKSLIALYGKPFKYDEQCFDRNFTFAVPPFGVKEKSIMNWCPYTEDDDSKNIIDLHSKLIYLAHKNTNKITVAFTNLNTLFSKSTGINFFRKKIVDNNWIDSIFLLPKGIFSFTNIPTAMLILRKEKEEKPITFIQYSDFSKKGYPFFLPDSYSKQKTQHYLKDKISSISKEEIIDNDYDLNPNKYIVSNEDKKLINIIKKRDTASLGALVDFLRPLPFKKSLKGSELSEIMISDIDLVGEVNTAEKKTVVSEQFLAKSNLPCVKKGDLVISIKGTLGKVGIIATDLPNTIPGPSLCILRTHQEALVKKEYIFQYLRSKLGQRMINRSSQGGYVPFISIYDLKNLKIPIPSLAEQKRSILIQQRSREIIDSIQKLKLELDNCIDNGWIKESKNSSPKKIDKKKSKDDSS